MALASARLTLGEFLELPDEEPALEYIDGVVRQKVSPKVRHGILQAKLAQCINAVAEPARVALAMTEVRATFAGESLIPDVSVYRWHRIPQDENGDVVDDSFVPPDIAVEIASPSQSANALFRRCRWLVTNGVEIALLIDPADRSILAFHPDGATDAWGAGDHIDIGSVVPGFELAVEELFASLHVGPALGS